MDFNVDSNAGRRPGDVHTGVCAPVPELAGRIGSWEAVPERAVGISVSPHVIPRGWIPLPNIVGCFRRGGRCVCARRDFTVSVYPARRGGCRFSLARPPSPPRRVCRLTDLPLVEPDPGLYASEAGMPCRVTKPCMIFTLGEDDREVVVEDVDEAVCRKYLTYPLSARSDVMSTWRAIQVFGKLAYRSAALHDFYRMMVFCGTSKCYPAPMSPDETVLHAARVLVEKGYLGQDFVQGLVERHGKVVIETIVGGEALGPIRSVALNFAEDPRAHTWIFYVFLWTGSDRVALRYAETLWRLHDELTVPVTEAAQRAGMLVGELAEEILARIEPWRRESYSAAPAAPAGADLVRVVVLENPVPLDKARIRRLAVRLDQILLELFGGDTPQDWRDEDDGA